MPVGRKSKSKLKFKKVSVKAPRGYEVSDPGTPIGRRRGRGKATLIVPFEKKPPKRKRRK